MSTDYLSIVELEAPDSLEYLTVALNTGQRVMSALPVKQILLARIMLMLHVRQYYAPSPPPH